MPDLLYKDDWDITKEHYKAWWTHEYFGRCALSVVAPKKDKLKRTPPSLPEKTEDRWLDLDFISAANDFSMGSLFYGGEAFPNWHPGHPGCDTHPVYLGAHVTLNEDTGWVYPFISCEDLTDFDYHTLKIDREGKWWKFGQECRRRAVKESKGKCIPSNMAFGGCGDTLAAIRDTQRLLIDIMECPDYVRDFDIYLMKQWTEIYEESYAITKEGSDGGSSCWFALWAPGKYYATQNDFAYMISPKMFSDIFLPAIELQTRYLDYAIHHVDGIGNFAHIDALMELPGIQAYQISPGEGKPSPLHFMDVLKKVQAHGKNLYITLSPPEIEAALQELSARGLFIDTVCSTEDEARELIKNVEKWSVDRG